MGYFPIKTYDIIIPLTSAQATATIAHLTPLTQPTRRAWKLMTFMMGPFAELVDDVDVFFVSMFFTCFPPPEIFEQRAKGCFGLQF